MGARAVARSGAGWVQRRECDLAKMAVSAHLSMGVHSSHRGFTLSNLMPAGLPAVPMSPAARLDIVYDFYAG